MTPGGDGGPRPPIFCALDVPGPARALALAEQVKEHVGGFKLGLEFFTANGPSAVAPIVELGLPVFLDLKLHDIPNTVAGAVRALRPLDVAFVTLHCQGGRAMMEAAAEASEGAIKLLGVTVMTSLDSADLHALGVADEPPRQVARLAQLAAASGFDGVVSSPQEIALIRESAGENLVIVTPGIRPAGAEIGDQKRVATPKAALLAGADWLVIGRPITASPNPATAAADIVDMLS